jgi:Tfp pilus assembly protein PilV
MTDSPKHRRGMTVMEVAIALGLLAAGMTLAAQVLAMCARQRLTGEQTMAAQWEAANVLEHLSGLRYEALTPQAAQDIRPSSQLQAVLPNAQLHVTIIAPTPASTGDAASPADVASSANSAAAGLPHKRIEVEITWPAQESVPHSVKVIAWKYAGSSEVAR